MKIYNRIVLAACLLSLLWGCRQPPPADSAPPQPLPPAAPGIPPEAANAPQTPVEPGPAPAPEKSPVPPQQPENLDENPAPEPRKAPPARELTFEEKVWRGRVEAALAPSPCPDIPKAAFPNTYYTGPLTDTHLHIPAIPDGMPGEDGEEPQEIPEGRFGGPMALLGLNVKMSQIACTLKGEGTTKNFAFFPVYEEIPLQLLEIWNRTMAQYPELFTPFIMPPGPHDVTPTVDAKKLKTMLAPYPGLFEGYGEIGLYALEGVRDDFPPDAPIFEEIYPIVEQHKLLVYMHPGDGHKRNFDRALREHPDINFIVHGDQIQGDILDLMDDYPNIYYGVDAFWGPGMDLFHKFVGESKDAYLQAMEAEFERVLDYEVRKWKPKIEKHPDRFLWGIDRGDAVWNYDLEVGQMQVRFARAFIGRLDPTVQKKIAYQNAERLASMSGPPAPGTPAQ